MRPLEVGAVTLVGLIAACSTHNGGGGSGGAGSGGASATGGAIVTGGAGSGGTSATGGASVAGGATGSGGVGSGGTNAAGGTTGSGGKGGGGTSAAGGATGGGGAGGGTTTKGGAGGGGGSGSGGATAKGGAGGSGGSGSGGSGGKDAPGSPDGSSACGTEKWVETNWSGGSDFFRLYAGPSQVFARTWDATKGSRTFLTSDNGATWTQVGSADTDMDILSVAMANDHVLAGTWNDLCQAEPGGTSFSPLTPSGIPADTAIWSLASVDTTLLAGTRQAVYRSSDNGATWTEVKSGIPTNAIVTTMVGSGNGILAGTDRSGVLTLPNAGSAWKTGDATLATSYINQLVVSGARQFAVTPDGLFVSTDNGSTWTADTSELKNVDCLLALDGRLWAGTDDHGVYVSTDAGATWASFSAGMPDGTRVWSLAATSENVFAGTSAGIWRVSCGK